MQHLKNWQTRRQQWNKMEQVKRPHHAGVELAHIQTRNKIETGVQPGLISVSRGSCAMGVYDD